MEKEEEEEEEEHVRPSRTAEQLNEFFIFSTKSSLPHAIIMSYNVVILSTKNKTKDPLTTITIIDSSSSSSSSSS